MTITDLPIKTMDRSSDKYYLKTFCKSMLKSQLFVGTFQEKRYVKSLNSYRDVIKVHPDEKNFIENIQAVAKKLRQELDSDITWIGLTGPEMIEAPVGHNLWVILPIEVFGTYWFKVKTIEFLKNEVRLNLEVVRPLRSERSFSDSEVDDNSSFDIKSSLNDIQQNLTYFYRNYITLKNIKETLIFIILLVTTILAGSINTIKYFMEYLLKFMREMSAFIKVCTPIILSCFEMIMKIIYGLFSLIIALWHGKPHPPPPQYFYYDESYTPGSRVRQRALPYRSSVQIVPLDD